MRLNKPFQRAAALLAVVSMALSMSVAAFAGTYYLDDGDITIRIDENGNQYVNGQLDNDEITITTKDAAVTTFEETNEDRPVADAEPVEDDTNETENDEQPAENDADEKGEAEVETPVEEEEEPTEEESSEKNEEPASEEEEGTNEVAEETEKAAEEQQPAEETAPEQEVATQEAVAPEAVNADVDEQANQDQDGFWDSVITIINNCVDKVAKVTLDNVKIDVGNTGTDVNNSGKAAISIEGKGDVELELDGLNMISSGFGRGGVEKNEGTGKLTIKDDNGKAGQLTAMSGAGGAGIGGGWGSSASNIEITGGTVYANSDPGASQTGMGGGAGIGGGAGGDGHDITISGGTVGIIAAGGGAGIGGGYEYKNADNTVTSGDGYDITISGGTVNIQVEAKSGADGTAFSGAGIGGGAGGDGHDITISDATVDVDVQAGSAAAIGGGAYACADANLNNISAVSGTGSNVTVSGDAELEVKTTEHARDWVENDDGTFGRYIYAMSAGATIGNAGKILMKYNNAWTSDSINEYFKNASTVRGEEIQADISGNGRIHHIVRAYNPDALSDDEMYITILEWWEPIDGSYSDENGSAEQVKGKAGVFASAVLPLHVEDALGNRMAYTTIREGSTLTVTAEADFARLHGGLSTLEELKADGVETIVFVTKQATSTHNVAELCAQGGTEFAVEHDGAAVTVLASADSEVQTCELRAKKNS